MITVSLHPFASRKILLLIAALVWLTVTAVFADPVWMNARAERLAQKAMRGSNGAVAVAKIVTPRNSAPQSAPVVEQTKIAPAEGPTARTFSWDELDTWGTLTARRFEADPKLTFWAISLGR